MFVKCCRPAAAPPRGVTVFRKLAAIAVVLFTALAGVVVGVAVAQTYMSPASVDNPIAIRGCVIRFATKNSRGQTVPTIHANSSHHCVGIPTVSVDPNNGDIVLGQYAGGSKVIVTQSVSADETLTARGIACGGSGTSIVRIRCYDRSGTKLPGTSSKLYGTYANLWVTVIMWDAAAQPAP